MKKYISVLCIGQRLLQGNEAQFYLQNEKPLKVYCLLMDTLVHKFQTVVFIRSKGQTKFCVRKIPGINELNSTVQKVSTEKIHCYHDQKLTTFICQLGDKGDCGLCIFFSDGLIIFGILALDNRMFLCFSIKHFEPGG